MIRVAIADDQELVRAGFKALIDSADDLEVVGEAANGEESLELVRQEHPDVVLMDIRMPQMDGVEATARIRALDEAGGVRVLILTTFDLDEYVHEALRAGASGFLLKDTSPKDLLQAIRVVAGGEALLAPSVTRRLIAEFAAPPAARPNSSSSPGRADRTRTRSSEPGGARDVQSGDRATARCQPGNGKDPHEPHPRQAQRTGQGPIGDDRLRNRARPARRGIAGAYTQRCRGGSAPDPSPTPKCHPRADDFRCLPPYRGSCKRGHVKEAEMTATKRAGVSIAAVAGALGILAGACVGVGVKDYAEFRSAVKAGASCSELFDIKGGFEGEPDEKRIERDLRGIGCVTAKSSRTDRGGRG